MSGNELSDLERRVKAIEKEIQDIREPLYTTLTDLRSTIAELENPFNYISKMIDLAKQDQQNKEGVNKPVEGGVKDATKNEGGLDKGKSDVKDGDKGEVNGNSEFKMNADLWQYQFNILVVSNLLLEVFDREELMRVLVEYVKDGWISRELAKAIEEAVNKLTINMKESHLDGVGLEEHLLTLYILYKLSNQPTDPVLPLLLILLNRLRRSSSVR